ncbi:MAG TPA: amidohydrolase family protein, partial [Thermoanaerobaculia bacterium]|nr:amidohydrolase family protein [Thermoanaerobaculia bacterium]
DEPCYQGPAPAPLVNPSGIKWIGDGTPIERLAFMSEPYQDRPETRGRFNFSGDVFTSLVERGLFASPKKGQLLFHLVGDAAIDTLLDEMEELAPAAHWRHRRTRIEHGDLMAPADVQRVKDLGVVVVQNPTHLVLPDIFQRYSPAVTAHAQPLRSLVETGVPLAFGTDGIGGSISPFLDLLLATLHLDRPSEALTLEQALIVYTAGSAYAEHEEDKKGKLVPGQLADLAVLSLDIFANPGALPATRSELTMVDGRIVWDTGVVH